MATVEDLEKLAEECLVAARTVKEYLASNGHQQPTFDQNGSPFFPHMNAQAEQARTQLRTASKLIYDLASGPDEILCSYVYNCVRMHPIILSKSNHAQAHDINAFRYVARFEIAKAVPLNNTISYRDLAGRTGTDEGQLKKMVRHLMMIHVFCEPKAGFVAHTASSKLLLHEGCAGFNGFESLDCASLVVHHLDAIEKWGHGSQEPNQTGSQIMYNSDEICFRIWENHPETMKRFSGTMEFCASWPPLDIAHAVAAFDWASVSGTVVDIGGNVGHCSIAFAKASPKAKFIVQDLAAVVERASNPATTIVPPDLKDRVSFMEHSFFDPQPIHGADAYFLRMIMHDYSDKYSIRILKAIIPAMQPHSRILIMDQIMPEVGAMPPPFERFCRTQDLMMSTLLNAGERDLEEWTRLFASVDHRLKIVNVSTPPGSLHSILEVVLTS